MRQRRPRPRLLRPTVLIFAAFAALLLVLACAAGAILWDSRRAARLNATQASENLVLSLERDIRRNVEVYDLSLRAAREGFLLPDFSASTPSARHSILFDGAAAAKHFASIIITDKTGAIIYDSGAVVPRLGNVAQRSYFNAHRSTPDAGLVITLIAKSLLTGQPTIALSRRIDGPGGMFMGVVVGGIRLGYFDDLFDHLQLGTQGNVALYTTDAQLVLRRPGAPNEFGRDVKAARLFAMLRDSPVGTYEAKSIFDGVYRLYSYRRVGDTPLVVVVGTSIRAIYADWVRKAWAISVIVAAFIGVAGLLAGLLRRELRQRSRAELLARRSRAKFFTYFSRLPIGFLAVRVTAERFIVDELNGAAETLFGMPAGKMMGREPGAIWPADQAHAIMERWRACVAGAQSVEYRETMMVGGEARDIRVLLTPVSDAAGRVWLLLDTRRDITDHLRSAQQGAATPHIARQDRMLAGFIQQMLRYQQRNDAAHQCGLLARRLQSVAGIAPLQPRRVPIQELLRDCLRQAAPTLPPAIALRSAVLPGVADLWADPSALTASVAALVDNARAALPAAGEIGITIAPGAQHSDPAMQPPAAFGVITIADAGRGMTEDQLRHAAEPFAAGDADHDGLGLAATSGFAEQSGGAMRIRSEPGQGTRVELWLPTGDSADRARVDMEDDG